jgi:hypothetical protein
MNEHKNYLFKSGQVVRRITKTSNDDKRAQQILRDYGANEQDAHPANVLQIKILWQEIQHLIGMAVLMFITMC